MINQEQLKAVLHYDPDTGVFTWRIDRGRRRVGDRAGYMRDDGYWFIKINQEKYCAHRLAWLYITGDWPAKLIDHIDGNPSNNRSTNLRDATPSENGQNRRGAQKNSRTGVLGVSPKAGGLFGAYILVNKVQINLGAFLTVAEAAAAYQQAKRRYHIGGPT